MVETLLGTLLGGAFRLGPELIKVYERNKDRQHELQMFDRQLEADRRKAEDRLNELKEQNEGALSLAEVQALIEASKVQGTQTGNAWIDGINSLMRPLITFHWVVVLYTVSLGAQFYILLQTVSVATAFNSVWTTDEKAIAASIISFWFVDRSIRKRQITK